MLDSAKWNLLFEFIKLEFQEWNWNIRIVLHWVIETSCLFGIVFLVQAFCFLFVCLFMCPLHGKQVLSGVVGGNMFFVGLRRKFRVRSRVVVFLIFN